MEQWKIIRGTNDLYEASDFGNVRRVRGLITNSPTGSQREVGGKVLSQKTKKNGYKEVNLYIEPQAGKMQYVHRLVATTWIGEIPEGYEVNHLDGDKSNNAQSNLEITSPSENRKHSFHVLGNKAPVMIGEEHPRTKLTEADVAFIRANYVKGDTNAELYDKFKNKISLSSFRKICYGETWKHTA